MIAVPLPSLHCDCGHLIYQGVLWKGPSDRRPRPLDLHCVSFRCRWLPLLHCAFWPWMKKGWYSQKRAILLFLLWKSLHQTENEAFLINTNEPLPPFDIPYLHSNEVAVNSR